MNIRLSTFLVLLALFFAGCSDTAVDPFENEEKYFTVWGYLDQLETDHTLRVVPVTRFAQDIQDPNDPQATLDAEMYTTDMTSGVRTRWFPSLE